MLKWAEIGITVTTLLCPHPCLSPSAWCLSNGGNAIIRRRLRGEQTGSRATTLAGSNGVRGHVCPQWQTTHYVSVLSFALLARASVVVPSLSLSFVFFFLMLLTCCSSLLLCCAVPVCSLLCFFEKPHFKQQTFPFLCYVPSRTFLYLEYLMPTCLLVTWVRPSLPVSWSKLFYLSYLPISM